MEEFSPEVREGIPYQGQRYVEIDNIYPVDYCDNLYLYDPQSPPHEITSGQYSSRTLSMSWEHARMVRDRLNQILSG